VCQIHTKAVLQLRGRMATRDRRHPEEGPSAA
jgi:hypothetical protein